MLKVTGLAAGYGKTDFLRGLSFSLEPGQWLNIVGPNGGGKSTLLKALMGMIPTRGSVELDGANLHRMPSGQRARKMGMLSQKVSTGYDFSVEEIVSMGRYVYRRKMWSGTEAENQAKIDEALRLTGMEEKRRKSILSLSGGEQQRVFIAQMLAQDPEVMLLDEPGNHLDIRYKETLFEVLDGWRKREGRTLIMVNHDLSLARAYGTHALLMREGSILAFGETRSVLTDLNLQRAYDTDVTGWMRRMAAQWMENVPGNGENEIRSR